MPFEFTETALVWRCCPHCKSWKLGCDPKNPGHTMPCPEPICRTGKATL